MIKVTVLYPNSDDSNFDRGYYENSHINLVKEKTGAALKEVTIDYGLSGGTPGSKAPFHAVANFVFDSLESFMESFAPHVPAFVADIPNYTGVEPILQISEIKVA